MTDMIDQPYAFNEYDEPPPAPSLKPEDLARLTADLLSDAEASHNNSGGVRTVSKGVLRKAADAITCLSRELEEARQSTLLVEKELIALRADADSEHAALTQARAEVARLSERLEITHVWQSTGGGPLKRVPARPGIPDGIECRDETIKLLEASLIQARAEIGRLLKDFDALDDAADSVCFHWFDCEHSRCGHLVESLKKLQAACRERQRYLRAIDDPDALTPPPPDSAEGT